MRQNGSIRGKAVNPGIRYRFNLPIGRFDTSILQTATLAYDTDEGGNVVIVRPATGSPSPEMMRLLLIGGGGAGGRGNDNGWEAGGGGAGGLIDIPYSAEYTLAAGTYSVIIGAGGTYPSSGTNTHIRSSTSGALVLTALGGGRGADGVANAPTGEFGSGGGGAHQNTAGAPGKQTDSTTISADSRTYGYGFAGGSGGNSTGGGGGGAGGAGAAGYVRGAVYNSNITGPIVAYAQGGGNGTGNGNVNQGGGGAQGGRNTNGLPGGSGLAVFRYPTSYANATIVTGVVEYSEDNNDRIFKFTDSGSITFNDDSGAPETANLGYV